LIYLLTANAAHMIDDGPADIARQRGTESGAGGAIAR